MIVDDEEDIRTIIKGSLASKYEIVEAHDGVDALATLEIAEPDFVILDVMMPLMNGFETCDFIRRHPRYSETHVMFLSALNSREDIKKGYGVGANLYLTKPFDPPRLLKNVDYFFQETPPPFRKKKFSIQEVHELQKSDALKVAQAHASVGWDQERSSTATEAPAPQPTKGASPLPSNPVDGKIRIVAADDDTDIRIFLRAVLEPQYEVVLAVDGLEAVDKITTYQPDLIILDAMMPRMSGYNLVQNLRRNARFTQTPVLFISGKATQRDRDYALKIGASEFLRKPFSPEELHSTLRNLTSPGHFQILPKSMTLAQINGQEQQRIEAQANEDSQKRDRLQRKEETELEKFLREHTR
jgi:DNA-binding response OmpR family regulator